MFRWFVLAVVCVAPMLAASGQPVAGAGPARPIPQVEHVCIVSIDGLRPDRALWAEMPNLRQLARTGAYSFWARTTAVSITLPSHVSMLTGVKPSRHGVEWNRDLPLAETVYPFVPTIFELAKKAGYSTAVVAGKSKFAVLNRPGTVDHFWAPREPSASNADVLAEATRLVENHRPNLIFVHFPEVDGQGHGRGWGSPEQLAAIEQTDRQLGELLAAFERAGIRRSTTFILTADHGGAGRHHGADDPRSRYIPWIVQGPGTRAGFDLTQFEAVEINTEDTAATACFLLGVAIPSHFHGKPVLAAFEPAPER